MSVETMNELRMTRTIKADQQAVWDAWTQPQHMKKWSCPDPTGAIEVEADLLPSALGTRAIRLCFIRPGV